jgi:hypothetical protein
VAKLYPIDGGARWGAPWCVPLGRRGTAGRSTDLCSRRARTPLRGASIGTPLTRLCAQAGVQYVLRHRGRDHRALPTAHLAA